jgi:hypothetical protein
MKLMAGNVKIASYRKHDGRWFHEADTRHEGPSVSLKAFSQGQRPAALQTTQAPPARPQSECYPCPDVGKLITMMQQGQALPPLAAPRLTRQALVCKTCGCVLCRCKVGKPGGLDAIVALQKAQGKRS